MILHGIKQTANEELKSGESQKDKEYKEILKSIEESISSHSPHPISKQISMFHEDAMASFENMNPSTYKGRDLSASSAKNETVVLNKDLILECQTISARTSQPMPDFSKLNAPLEEVES